MKGAETPLYYTKETNLREAKHYFRISTPLKRALILFVVCEMLYLSTKVL